MSSSRKIFTGTDSGTTTSKFSAVWENGEAVSTLRGKAPMGDGSAAGFDQDLYGAFEDMDG